jgi:hypothetical protein
MEVLGFFRRGGIRDAEALADFLDKQAALLAQNVVEDYTRTRAGTEAEPLFADAAFRAALERSRWEAYPIVLTMLTELAQGILCTQARDAQPELFRALEGIAIAAFDRHSAPAASTPGAWAAARADFLHWLGELTQRQPKQPASIVESSAPSLLAIMPVHDALHGESYYRLRDYLQTSLNRLHDQLVRQVRPRVLVAAMLGRR